MKSIKLITALFLLNFSAFGQTNIQMVITNLGQHKIDAVDAFDLSQEEFRNYPYQDTIEMVFAKSNIDCYNIRYHEQGKMFRQQIWLNPGNIKIEAHIDSERLVIDTVMNAPIYYAFKKFFTTLDDLYKSKDSTALDNYMIATYLENIENPFSLIVATNYIEKNKNSKSSLLKFKPYVDKQGDKFKWFLLYSSVAERLNKLLSVNQLKFNEYSFINKEGKVEKLTTNAAEYYVLDFWFLACPPCIEQHKEIKTQLDRLKQQKIEFIGISTDKNLEKWKSYLEKHEYTWPNFLQDRGKTITDQLGISGFPTYLILDKTGKILEMNSSFSNVLKWFKLD